MDNCGAATRPGVILSLPENDRPCLGEVMNPFSTSEKRRLCPSSFMVLSMSRINFDGLTPEYVRWLFQASPPVMTGLGLSKPSLILSLSYGALRQFCGFSFYRVMSFHHISVLESID